MKTPAIIFDRDGTLARIDRRLVEGEKPDWESFHAAIAFDTPVPSIVALTQMIDRSKFAIIISTGRGSEHRLAMSTWLNKHDIFWDYLFMRKIKDQRADHVVKEEMYDTFISQNFDVRLVVDDRPSVCDMWRSKGLTVLQVSQPEEIAPFQFIQSQQS